jgi:ankyrin repeat protein
MATFNYDPIDLSGPAFRLLRLLKGGGDTIHCELFQALLCQREIAVSYEALSYVWGSTETKCTIDVNGKQLEITNNLYKALRLLRLQNQDRILWVDAVCIHQSDNKERGHQVKHMGYIYKEAAQVIYWLGPSTYSTDFCLDSLRLLQEESNKHAYRSWSRQKWMEFWRKLGRQYPGNPGLQLDGLRFLLDQPWFKRVWILQEVANSQSAEVYCGQKSVSARIFALAPFLMDIKPDVHCQAVLDIMPGPFRKHSWWSESRDLYTLLKNFGDSEASDHRDLIYALLGMSSDAINALQPDYDKTEQEVIWSSIDFLYRFNIKSTPISGLETIRDLCNQISPLNNIALEVAAENGTNGDEAMEFLLRHRSSAILVSGNTMRAAAKNRTSALKMLKLLLQYLEDNGSYERSMLDSCGLVEAAAENESSADEVLEFLLTYQKHRFFITEKCLETAARNRMKGKRSMEVFLSHQEPDFTVTTRVVEAAAENDLCGHEIVRFFLQHGRYTHGLTEGIIKSAAKNKATGEQVLALLLTQVESGDESLAVQIQQVLDWAAPKSGSGESLLRMAVDEGRVDIFRLLLDWIPAADSWSRQRLLALAARKGHKSMVEMLLTRGADANRVDATQYSPTPLGNAVESGNEEVVRVLLAQGADVEVKDPRGQTPLSKAAEMGKVHLVNLLLEVGRSDANSKDSYGRTPLVLAAMRGHTAIVQALLANGAGDAGQYSKHTAPLTWAAQRGHEAIVKLLLESSVYDVSHDSMNEALILAVDGGYDSVVEAILDNGADLEIRSIVGRTPLISAARRGHDLLVKRLLEKGADLSSRCDYGFTALDYADRGDRAGHKVAAGILRKAASTPPGPKKDFRIFGQLGTFFHTQ